MKYGVNTMKNTTRQSGQILLISLLVLSVATTIALSLIGRTATDQNITNDLSESQQALAAAEAGVEMAVKTGVGSGGTQVLAPSISYTTTVTSLGSAVGPYLLPEKTQRNGIAVVWLVNHASDGSLTITPTYTASSLDVCWNTDTTIPALVVTVFYKKASDGSYRTVTQAFDPNSSRQSSNLFTLVGGAGTNCGQSGFYKATLNFPSLGITPSSDTLLTLDLRPLYADAQFAVDSGVTILPLQGTTVESSGFTGTGVTQKVIQVNGFRTLPSVFDAAIFSQSAFGH